MSAVYAFVFRWNVKKRNKALLRKHNVLNGKLHNNRPFNRRSLFTHPSVELLGYGHQHIGLNKQHLNWAINWNGEWRNIYFLKIPSAIIHFIY